MVARGHNVHPSHDATARRLHMNALLGVEVREALIAVKRELIDCGHGPDKDRNGAAGSRLDIGDAGLAGGAEGRRKFCRTPRSSTKEPGQRYDIWSRFRFEP